MHYLYFYWTYENTKIVLSLIRLNLAFLMLVLLLSRCLMKQDDALKDTIWTPPACGWLKFNFDGAFCEWTNHASLGVISRVDRGILFLAKLDATRASISKVVECLAMQLALSMTLSLRLEMVVLEGDSLEVISLFSDSFLSPPWIIDSLI